MRTRLFHSIVAYGAALGFALGCSSEGDTPEVDEPNEVSVDGGANDASLTGDTNDGASVSVHESRCRLPDGGCHEHCTPLPAGECLDPCFVHTVDCSPDCLLADGSCGWPPTK